MQYKKCPICDLNYIKDGQEICDVCSKKAVYGITNPQRPQLGLEYCTCTVKNEPSMHRGLFGYKAYINNICVGIVFATVDKRTPAYNCCELSYYPEFFSQFGEWHRIKSNGERIRFAYLEDKIKKDRSYTFIIDK